ncbi:MAG: thermonuclease family protein [Candidatus Daviesbacteria bacterium]|nr:thermonuclease family protein [Candidatus Daviesbacteria bacterium]
MWVSPPLKATSLLISKLASFALKESTEFNRKLVEGKTVSLEYDQYKADKFGRILAYVIIDGKNVSMELAKAGMAQVVIYQHKRPFIYQEQLLKAQEEAKKKNLGMWSS